MGRLIVLAAVVCGLALAACGGKDKAGEADAPGGPPDSAEVVGADGDATTGDALGSDACKPDCEGKECGDDGCGGTCGECGEGDECLFDWTSGEVVCTYTCESICELENAECGNIFAPGPHEEDGCYCGGCPPDRPICTESAQCSSASQDKDDFGWPCEGNADCLSGFCIQTPTGKRCTTMCGGECPSGFACASNSALDHEIFICVPEALTACRPCHTDEDCAPTWIEYPDDAGWRCASHGAEGWFCASECRRAPRTA